MNKVSCQTRCIFFIILLICFYLPKNPIIELQRVLSLSPAPIERIFGIKSLFSGATTAFHYAVRGDIIYAFKFNIVYPFFFIISIKYLIKGELYNITNKKEEFNFFFIIFILSLINNYTINIYDIFIVI